MIMVFLKVRVCLIALLILFVSTGSASSEFRSSAGFGIQFGGIIGWQGSVRSGDNNLRFAVGVPRLSVGYDRFIKNRYSIGLQGFILPVAGGVGVNINYYFSDVDLPGWMLGLDLSRTTAFGEESTNAVLSFGYRF